MRYHALAADYDGTLAHHGRVDDTTWEALRALKASGRRIVLVTGRELPDLFEIVPDPGVFDRIVAENGAVLYDPAKKATRALAPAPPKAFAEELRRRGIERVAEGEVIVATWEPHQDIVLSTIHDLGLELAVIFNKGAVMVLPPGVNKAFGLRAALVELELSVHDVVAVGDAENDHAMLAACGLGVAVANALPSVKEAADWTTPADHGAGIVQLVARLLDPADELADANRRHHIELARTVEGDQPVWIDPPRASMLVCGTSGSGKSTFTTGLLERMHDAGYQVLVIDPEGDFAQIELATALVLGDGKRAPMPDEVMRALAESARCVVVDLLGVALAHRPAHAAKLLAACAELRASTGRPHLVVVDEAHHMLPAAWQPARDVAMLDSGGMLFVTVHPESVARPVLETIQRVVAFGERPDRTLAAFATARGSAPPALAPIERLPVGRALSWTRDEAPIEIAIEAARGERQRHSRKYAEGNLGADRSFVFRGPTGALRLAASNLMLFLLIGDGVDDATWDFHLERGDYSTWVRKEVKDGELADAIAAIERARPGARESRAQIRAAIEASYTLPAEAPSGHIDPA